MTTFAAVAVGCGSHPLPPREAVALVEPPPDEQAIEALGSLQLTAVQQRQLGALRRRVAAELGPTARERARLVDVVLDALEQGQVDRGRIDPVARAFVSASERSAPSLLAALDELHGILTPTQRAALVAELGKRSEASGDQSKRYLKQLVRALDLTLGQQLEIAAAAKKRFSGEQEQVDRLKEQLRAAASAFEGEEFHADALEISQGPLVEHWVGVVVSMFELIVPMLDPPQRTTLVAMARKMMGARPSPEQRGAVEPAP